MSYVKLDRVSKLYGGFTALKECNLEVRAGEFLSLLGPSGCGKTTTLRLIAGFLTPTQGEIYVQDRPISKMPPFRRNFGIVFQNYALFPHMTVFENIAFGLRMRKLPKDEVQKRVKEALELIRLAGMESRYPSQLSGGQQQRVALARALVIRPTVLLLDEPFGALDRKLREEMQVELRSVVREVGVTTLFVTHDQEEALTMSDRIAVMRQGVIEQLGTPQQIYDTPSTRFVAQFIGTSNFFTGQVEGKEDDRIVIRCGTGAVLRAAASGGVPARGSMADLAVRPEKLRLRREPDAGWNAVQAIVTTTVYQGARTQVYLRTEAGETLVAERTAETGEAGRVSAGDTLFACWQPEDCCLVQPDQETGAR